MIPSKYFYPPFNYLLVPAYLLIHVSINEKHEYNLKQGLSFNDSLRRLQKQYPLFIKQERYI